MKQISFIFLMAFSLRVGAVDEAKCPRTRAEAGALEVKQMYFAKSDACALIVHKNLDDPQWRMYHFSSNGLFMIFANFGDGDESTDTGAQSYYLFPRLGLPTWKETASYVTVSMSGVKFKFSKQSGDLVDAQGISIKVEPLSIDRKSAGVFIRKYSGIFIDSGFSLGTASTMYKNRRSYIYRSNKELCRPKNQEIFDYIYSTYPNGERFLDEVELKFRSSRTDGSDQAGDQALTEFINEGC